VSTPEIPAPEAAEKRTFLVGEHADGDAEPEPSTVQNDPAGSALLPESREANIVRLEDARLVKHANSMKSEELAAYVTKSGWGDVLLKLVHLKPYIEVLWGRFAELKNAETIAECHTKEEFCEQCLHRSIRAMQYMLYGRTPAKTKATLTPVRFAPPVPEASAAATPDEQQLGEDSGPSHEKSPQAVSDQVLVEPPTTPPIVGEPVPEPVPGSLEELGQKLSHMADTNEIAGELKTYLLKLVQPLFQRHAYTLATDISIQITRDGQYGRIVIDDWVEYRGGDTRLTKQTGQETTLGRVVGEDELRRPRVRWYDGQDWTKPYTLFNYQENSSFDDDPSDDTVRVLFGHQAAERYPKAFSNYDAAKEEKRSLRKPAAPAEKTVDSQSETAEPTVAPEIAGNEPETQEPPAQSVPTKKKPVGTATAAKSVKSLTADGVTVAVGFHCKVGGVECEIVAVSDGDDPSVSLVRSSDGKAFGSTPIEELRFITDPDAAA
jgi:hypothetical protein